MKLFLRRLRILPYHIYAIIHDWLTLDPHAPPIPLECQFCGKEHKEEDCPNLEKLGFARKFE
jgi:hypothetical protein